MKMASARNGVWLHTFFLFLLLHANAQQRIRLNDGWEFLKQDLGSVWEGVRPVTKGGPETVPLWEKIQLPHCVNATDAVDAAGNYYQGPVWYRTQLQINNPYQNGRTLLHFEGAGQKTTVYVYDVKAGVHTGGYDEWTVDITNAAAAFSKTAVCQNQFKGKIPVLVRCDNSRDAEMIPSSLSDFSVYGGIYRYLNLVYMPAVAADKIFLTPTVTGNGNNGALQVKLRLYNPVQAAPATVSISLSDPQGNVIGLKEKKIAPLKGDIPVADFAVRHPQLWQPDDPALYSVTVKLASGNDTFVQTQKTAFRYFEFADKGPFYLNGKRLLLQGTQRHDDHAGVGAAMTEVMMRREMRMIKEMGANFIRLGHYQQSRIILDLCDSLGIMVWEEIPWCRGGLGGALYKAQAKRMLTNMIEQHYNHPSVIIWGLGNENDWPGDFKKYDSAAVHNFMKELNALSHQLDPSRKTAIRRCDFCKDITDVYSPSIWAGWYRGNYTDYKSISEAEAQKVKHFLHAEWGGDSHAGRHAEKQDDLLKKIPGETRPGDAISFGEAARISKDGGWSESYICNLTDWHLKEQETMPWLSGSAQWVFKDFSTPLRPDNPVPYVNQKGVVTRDGTKKESYFVFQSYWSDAPMVHIYGHSWPVRWGDAGEEKMLKVYSNCDEATLLLNGKDLGVRKRNSADFPAAGLRWNAVFDTGMNHVTVVAKKGNIAVKDSISFRYQTEKWGTPAKLQLQKIHAENDMITLQATLLDSNNVLCLDAANTVYFSIAGEGMLMDKLGTPDGSNQVQLYNGRALIRMRANGGRSVVSVIAKNIQPAFITVE